MFKKWFFFLSRTKFTKSQTCDEFNKIKLMKKKKTHKCSFILSNQSFKKKKKKKISKGQFAICNFIQLFNYFQFLGWFHFFFLRKKKTTQIPKTINSLNTKFYSLKMVQIFKNRNQKSKKKKKRKKKGVKNN